MSLFPGCQEEEGDFKVEETPGEGRRCGGARQRILEILQAQVRESSHAGKNKNILFLSSRSSIAGVDTSNLPSDMVRDFNKSLVEEWQSLPPKPENEEDDDKTHFRK